jgi:hypothetical protein
MVPAVVPVQDDPVEFVVSFHVVPSHHLILLAVQVKSPALPVGLVHAAIANWERNIWLSTKTKYIKTSLFTLLHSRDFKQRSQNLKKSTSF